MKLIDKDSLVAEIERRKKYYENIQIIKPVYESNIEDFSELLSFIDTLEVTEVDLYEEADNYWGTLASDVRNFIYLNDFYRIAKHFFELGLKVQKGEDV